MEVVEWSARLARKQAFGVRRLPAPLSMMHIPPKAIVGTSKKVKQIAQKDASTNILLISYIVFAVEPQ